MSRNPKALDRALGQTDSPAFKAWFSDSKVVDPSGRPLVVYHGTTADFAVFDGGKAGAATQAAWSEMGHFFTEDPSLASDFTKGKNWAKSRSLPRRGGNVMPVYLAIMNPMYVPAARALPMSGSVDNVRALRAKAVASGHDGIVIEPFRQSFGFDDTTNELVVPQYIAFRPEQIKSVIGNRGTFAPTNPDIRFSQKMQDLNSKSQDSINQSAVPDVAGLQKQLAEVEAKYEVLRIQKKQRTPEWDAIEKEAGPIRVQLFELTGDYYGRPKVKPVKPSDYDLLAEYETPGDVPQHVMNWLLKRNQILTSDATDAVRWSRIVGTKNDERFPAGDLTLYRAVVGDEIRPGDWATTDLGYAQEHLRRYLGRDGQVLQLDVDGRDVLVSPTGNYKEAIYAPREFSGAYKPNEVQETVARERER